MSFTLPHGDGMTIPRKRRPLARLQVLILAAALMTGAVQLDAKGPTYSRYGIGDRLFFGSGRAYGMGLAGISLTGSGFVNRWNPAALSGIQRVLFSGSLELNRFMVTDPWGTSNYNRGEFQSLALAVPIERSTGITVAFDITPYSKVRYGVDKNDLDSPYPSTQTLVGTGSITALSASGSVALTKDLSLGIRLSHLFGRIEQVLSVKFEDPEFVDSDTYVNQHHNGNMVSGGVIFSGFKSMLGIDALEPVTLGLIVSSPSSLTVRADREYFSSFLSDTTLKDFGTTSIPLSYGMGISYLVNNRYVLSGELISELWSDATFYDSPPTELRNSLRAALGFESLPNPEGTTFWSRVSYSAGAAYHASSLVLDGKGVDEVFGSLGVGLPLGGTSRLRMTVHGGIRGTGDASFAREKFVRLSLTLSVGEDWITRIDED
jgi:hypothetical protein